MSDDTTPTRRGFGYLALIGAALVGLIGGGFASSAFGHGGFGMRHWGGGPGGWGHHRMHGDAMDPEHAKRHAEHMIERLAWAVDATPEQKQKLTAIGQSLAADMQQMHTKMQASHKRAVELLRAPQVDRAALETFRAEHIAFADEASKRVTQAIGDAAEVLTPAQRAKLAARWDF